MIRTLRPALGLVALAFVIGAVPVRAEEFDFQAFHDKIAPSLARVKYYLKMEVRGQAIGGENEISGIVIDPKGVILCSNEEMNGYLGILGQSMGGMGSTLSDTPTKPSEFKVTVGEDEKEWTAELIARDPDLDLAWLKLQDVGDTTFPAVDYGKSATPKRGEQIYWIGSMGQNYGYALATGDDRVAAFLEKPRKLYAPGGSLNGPNLPVFNAKLEPIGMSVFQLQETKTDTDDPFQLFMSVMRNRQQMGTYVLPAEQIVKATTRAMKDPEDQ